MNHAPSSGDPRPPRQPHASMLALLAALVLRCAADPANPAEHTGTGTTEATEASATSTTGTASSAPPTTGSSAAGDSGEATTTGAPCSDPARCPAACDTISQGCPEGQKCTGIKPGLHDPHFVPGTAPAGLEAVGLCAAPGQAPPTARRILDGAATATASANRRPASGPCAPRSCPTSSHPAPRPAGRRPRDRLVRDPRHHRRVRLEPGDSLLHDNHRTLHARTGFTGFTGARWVRGVYFDD